jgi:transcriptional regulator with GAF, ATPase, and Fis domain
MTSKTALKKMVEELEKKEILEALQQSGGIKSRAAIALGLSERMFNYRVLKYGIEVRREARIVSDKERPF